MEVPFSCIKKLITAHCLICFDTAENEPPIMNHIRCKPLCVPSCTIWQKIRNKHWIIWYNYNFKVTPLTQILAWGGLLFECPTYAAKLRYIKIKDTVAVMVKPVLWALQAWSQLSCCADDSGDMTYGMPTCFWVTLHGRWRQALHLSRAVFQQLIKNLKNHEDIHRIQVSVTVSHPWRPTLSTSLWKPQTLQCKPNHTLMCVQCQFWSPRRQRTLESATD